jgi:hypothetical protein
MRLIQILLARLRLLLARVSLRAAKFFASLGERLFGIRQSRPAGSRWRASALMRTLSRRVVMVENMLNPTIALHTESVASPIRMWVVADLRFGGLGYANFEV